MHQIFFFFFPKKNLQKSENQRKNPIKMALRFEEGSFQSPVDGLKISLRSWVPESAKAVVIISHGYLEHCGRYERVAKELVSKGYACYGIDHRSHGRSEDVKKTRGLMMQFSDIVDDFNFFVNKIIDATAATTVLADGTFTPQPFAEALANSIPSNIDPKVPIFIFGHSMGGLNAIKYVQDYGKTKPIRGVVLSSPYLKNVNVPNCLMRNILGLVGKVAPSTSVAAIDKTLISSDKDECERYWKDPLNGKAVPALSADQLMVAHDEVAKRAAEFKLPLLVVQGDKDKVVDMAGTVAWLKNCGCSEQEMKLYAGGFHELLNEKTSMREEVTKDILSFLEAKCQAKM